MPCIYFIAFILFLQVTKGPRARRLMVTIKKKKIATINDCDNNNDDDWRWRQRQWSTPCTSHIIPLLLLLGHLWKKEEKDDEKRWKINFEEDDNKHSMHKSIIPLLLLWYVGGDEKEDDDKKDDKNNKKKIIDWFISFLPTHFFSWLNANSIYLIFV